MVKKNYKKKILALFMAVAVSATSGMPVVSGIRNVVADSVYSNENLSKNSTFEEGVPLSSANGQSHAGNWHAWQSAEKTTEQAHGGKTSVKLSKDGTSLEQDIPGLQKGMTYTFRVWAKLSSNSESAKHWLGVKNYGGDEIKVKIDSAEWKEYTLDFVYSGTSDARVYEWIEADGGVVSYFDDAVVEIKSDIQKVSIENGKLEVVFREGVTSDVSALSATYTTSIDASTPKELKLTQESLNANTLVLKFDEIQKAPVSQKVDVVVTYKGQNIPLDFTVEESGEEVVNASIKSVTAENGKVTVVLDKNPTVAPVNEDFTWKYQVDGEKETPLEVKDFAYDKETATVTATFDEMRGSSEKAQNVEVKVAYKDQTPVSGSFEILATQSHIFYVDSTNGSDSNDGLSPEKAFQTIDKLNTITFIPGDEIRFKKGETFVGAFQPQGSGEDGNPIKIGSYGDGKVKPKLMPGENWTVPYLMSANAMVKNVKVNHVIRFYNQEYWEVSDLEIVDPRGKDYITKGSDVYIGNSKNDVYRSGINIAGEDIGELEHFYIDNVEIHGFHGPGTNIGKSSGGITMNVITNEQRNRENSTPTRINDIRITNCEIYDVGRSGINFLTPWSYRTDEKWGPFDYGTKGYDYFPYEDFYLGNNYIHDVDGDGLIIDNCKDAVAEKNLVTRTCLRPATEGGGAAVGMFNWNSDDTTFQFNEVYDIRSGAGATASNDSQGIEIDALNDRTWVQYNYVHDNKGGFMMLCNVSDNYRSFDGIIRYNISQNDYAHPRQGMFDIYAANYGTEVYNNTFYMTERALKDDKLFLFSAASAYETMKFYNNIFYYDGEEKVEANTFGDGAIDWESNIFYGFNNVPKDDNEGAPNMLVDPKLKAPGTGGTGKYPGDKVDLSCYELQDDSPALNAGMPVADNGGRDYFGNEVVGIPDIGAYESGKGSLKMLSKKYTIDQNEKKVILDVNEKVTARLFMENIIIENGVTAEIKRGSAALSGGVRLNAGDQIVITGSDKEQSEVYTVELVEGEEDLTIPVEDLAASAGSSETQSSNDIPENVLDGKTGTIWHTSWNGCDPSERYLTLEVKNDYTISGYVYTPREANSGSGAANGVITKYAIYVSDDNQTWGEPIAQGDWEANSDVKVVRFEKTVKAKYVKLLAVESVGNFASAAEARLEGTRNYSDTEAPTAPQVRTENVTETTAELRWLPSEDNEGVVEYQLKNGADIIATFDAESDYYLLTDLEKNKEYTYTVYAVDLAGNVSKGGEVTFVTDSGKPKDGWKETAGGWIYYENGNRTVGWKVISEKWYYFNEDGIMETGWVFVGDHWYYLNQWGAMETGWVFVGDHWYYLNQWGAMETGWVFVGGHWYYLNQWGAMETGWVSVDGHWYYANIDGVMQIGWVFVGGHWYYLDQWGAMETGWIFVDGRWYYLNRDGSMAVSQWIGDYYVQSDGSMATSQWINGYYVDTSGRWVRNV